MTGAQHWDPDRYARNARFVADLGMPVVELLAPKPGERILDLGCGDGALTEKLVGVGCDVVGVDASPEQIAAAKRRGIAAEVCDAEQLSYREEFDAVFSNAALHWMTRPEPVIAGVWGALRPGGRFVAECGGAGNITQIVRVLRESLRRRGIDPDLIQPWYYAAPDEYRAKLEQAGFRVRVIELFDRPTPLPGSMTDWLETFAEAFLKAVLPSDRAAYAAEVSDSLRDALCDADGKWTADYVRLRFAADKPR